MIARAAVLRRATPVRAMACLLLLVLASPAGGADTARSPHRRALLIGVQSYAGFGSDWQNLDGPVNDVRMIRELLTERFGFDAASIRLLEDGDATSANVRKAFSDLCDQVETGDVVYIHYSGHGSRVKDANGDEGDGGFDSSLVPVDSRREGSSEILDDEIRIWLSRIAAKASNVALVVDACHSGTITRGGGALKVRGAPTRDARDYSWSRALVPELRRAGEILDASRVVTRISACLDPEWANEYQAPDGKTYGFLTWNFARTLMSAAPGQSWESVFRSTEASMSATFRDRQHPRFEGVPGLPIFGARFAESPAQIAVLSAEASAVRLRGGILNGVTPGSLFERTGGTGEVSRIEILSATAFESTARVRSGDVPRPGLLYTEAEHRYPFPGLRIRIRSEAPTGDWPERLARSVRLHVKGAETIESGVADMLLALERIPGSGSAGRAATCRILDGLEQPYGDGSVDPALLTTRLDQPGDADRVARKIALLLCNRALLKFAAEFQNSGPGIDLEVLHLTGTAAPGDRDAYRSGDRSYRYETLSGTGDLSLPPGSRIAFRLRNGSPLPCYAYFINVTPDGGIQSLFPRVAGSDDLAKVPAGGVSAWGTAAAPGWVVELTDAGLLDTYVCFVTESPAPLWGFDSPGLAGEDANVRGGSDSGPLDYNDLKAKLQAESPATRGAGSVGRLDPRTKTIARTITIRVTS